MDEDLKARLLKPRVPEGTVELDGLGTIRVRGLSRAEVFMTQQAKGIEATERKILALGMVDPAMTEDEVRLWQQSSPGGEMEPVAKRISELSGLALDADKSGLHDVRGEPGE